MLWRENSCGKEKRWKDFLELLLGVSKNYEGPLSRPAGHNTAFGHECFAFLLFTSFVHVHASYTVMALAAASNSANFFFLFFFFFFPFFFFFLFFFRPHELSLDHELRRVRVLWRWTCSLTLKSFSDFITTICRLCAPQEYERNERNTIPQSVD